MDATSAALAVETEGLVKVFGRTRAVDGIALRVPAGCVHVLLGPEGAGTTTTLRLLATQLRPDAGTARVLGCDVVTEAAAVRARIGVPGESAPLHGELTGAENLLLLARLLGYSRAAARQRTDQLIAAFGLLGAAGRRLATYPDDARRRLDLAASIVVRPDLVLLDRPTDGLDAGNRSQVEEVVRALVRGGTTVLLATSDPAEADRLADRISVMASGRVVTEGTPGELRTAAGVRPTTATGPTGPAGPGSSTPTGRWGGDRGPPARW